ncbi:MAG TPA: DEAD/DEAH box helicase [Kofleriaceae bacterium]|nr:DEAD/DEAH box helicase [Kofleriaceae bacterium]
MSEAVPFARVPAGLAVALEKKGFQALTTVQEAVLEPSVAGRDLRISSQTGSGKTVAIGMALAAELEELESARGGPARPRVLLIAPTRELAAQIAAELRWLFRPLHVRLAVVTGGTNVGGDLRALREGPHVLVGTPGRLVDHLDRGTIDLSALRAVVLDEADEMLDMGFRDDLEKLLDATPSERRTHLVSATLPREVLHLARRYQRDPVFVRGENDGEANQDINHVGHLVRASDRVPALINVLLATPGQRTLVFVRTRAATAELATQLAGNGFSATPLSGEMGQRERTAALEAFRSGAVRIVVATDVAARGLDIQDVTQIIHFDQAENPEVYTHRSGRTGRAGNKGTSVAFAPPGSRRRVEGLLRRAGISITWRPVPSAASIQAAADDRLVAEIEQARGDEPRLMALAARLVGERDPLEVIAALVGRSVHSGACAPHVIRDVVEPSHAPREARPPRDHRGPGHPGSIVPHGRTTDFTAFHITWGATDGANASRLLAMVCRRGDVRSDQIGAIRVGPHQSMVEVASQVAVDFARATQKPDPRNPRIKIRRWDHNAPPRADGPRGRDPERKGMPRAPGFGSRRPNADG